MNEAARWWGEWSIEVGAARRWRIGPLELVIERRARELRVATEEGLDPFGGSGEIAATHTPAEHSDRYAHRRFIWGGDERVSLVPRLADRSVVFRPETPLTVLEGDEIELFVSSPMWVDVAAGEAERVLCSVPTFRPSDTWLGSTPVEGELCYASPTHCRLDLDELPLRPHRAVTSVLVRNRGEGPFVLDRVSVPVPTLGLYAPDQGALRTSSVTLTREEAWGQLAQLDVVPGPPPGEGAELISPPRLEPVSGGLVRAFAGLF